MICDVPKIVQIDIIDARYLIGAIDQIRHSYRHYY